MGNIAFVASTLPISLIKAKAKDWEIDEIVIAGKNIERSFLYLNNVESKIKTSVVPTGSIKNFLFIFKKLLGVLLGKKKAYFFHECCWFNFDFLIDFIRVQADYYPQATLNSFIKTETDKIQSRYHRCLLNLLGKTNSFVQYKVIEDNNEGYYFVLAKRKYLSNVTVHDIRESAVIKKNKIKRSENNKSILLLLSRETVDSKSIAESYENVIDQLTRYGYKISIKNHPRQESRLDVSQKNIQKEYDPHIPFELIEDSFLCVIGCASTSLKNSGQESFSIIKFCGMTPENIELRVRHLLSLPGENTILFPESIDDMMIQINNLSL